MSTELLTVRLADKQTVAQDIVMLDLQSTNGQELPAFEPGAHIDVHLPGGYIRQFSLLNDCRERQHYRVAVLRETDSRGGSVAAHDRLAIGDALPISMPRNRFMLVDAPHSLLFAGGIGVTPLLCMARHLLQSNADFTLHYSCRNQARAAFLDDIRNSPLDLHTRLHFDDDADTLLDAHAVLHGASEQTHIYICGPAGYIKHIETTARAAGIPESRIHVERFSLGDDETSPAEPVTGDVAFQVELASTGEVFDIPADETVTYALDRQGVYIPVSCEEGICGTCLTGVVDGIPDHRDSYLTDEEHAANDQFTPCCSRAKTKKLIIDL